MKISHLLLSVLLCASSFPRSSEAVELKAKGFIKTGMVGANRATSSFASENLVAPTAARPSGDFAVNDKEVASFQTAQTRLAMEAIVDPETRGYVEVDFLDFSKSSPFSQMAPRVRIAKIDYNLSDTMRVTVGQDWDTFSPANTSSYNYVGNSFQAGNSGFLRPQAVLTSQQGDLEIRYALGMVGSNASVTTGDVEKADLPTLALALAYGKTPSRVGFSFIGGRLKFSDNSPKGYAARSVYGMSAFAERGFSSGTLRMEVYASQNLENTGSLTLSRGRARSNVKDAGGFISGKFNLSEKWATFGTVGIATVLNKDSVSSASSLAAGRRSFDAETLGITTNVATKLGIDHKFTEKLSWFAEVSRFQSTFKNFGNAKSYVLDTGLFLAI